MGITITYVLNNASHTVLNILNYILHPIMILSRGCKTLHFNYKSRFEQLLINCRVLKFTKKGRIITKLKEDHIFKMQKINTLCAFTHF